MTDFKVGDFVRKPDWGDFYEITDFHEDGRAGLRATIGDRGTYYYTTDDLIKREEASVFNVGDKVTARLWKAKPVTVLAVMGEWLWGIVDDEEIPATFAAEGYKLLPKWEPKVGEKAVYAEKRDPEDHLVVTVLAIDGDECWLRTETDYRFESYVEYLEEVK